VRGGIEQFNDIIEIKRYFDMLADWVANSAHRQSPRSWRAENRSKADAGIGL